MIPGAAVANLCQGSHQRDAVRAAGDGNHYANVSPTVRGASNVRVFWAVRSMSWGRWQAGKLGGGVTGSLGFRDP